MRYHSGTAAFGGLILAVVQSIRAFILYLQMKFGQRQVNNLFDLSSLPYQCWVCFFMCLIGLAREIYPKMSFLLLLVSGRVFEVHYKTCLYTSKSSSKRNIDNLLVSAAVCFGRKGLLGISHASIWIDSSKLGPGCDGHHGRKHGGHCR